MNWFLVLYVLAVLAPAIWTEEQTCSVQPNDDYVELGSNITLTCPKSCTPDTSYWTINGSRTEGFSTFTNSSYLVLFIKAFSHSSATIVCHTSDKVQRGGIIIRSLTKPNNVSCILQYSPNAGSLPDLFTCNWKHNMIEMETSYSMHIKGVASQKVVEGCNKTSCMLPVPDTPFHYENISVVVRAKFWKSGKLWETDSVPYELNAYHIWQLHPPVIYVNVLSNHLLVEWEQPLDDRQIICEVKYGEHVLNHSVKPGHVRVSVTTEEVESCTNYTVSARCALTEAHWSTWSQERTVISQYKYSKLRLWRKVGEPNISKVRRVWVMWRAIPPTCSGQFEYQIQRIPEKMSLNAINNYTVANGSVTCAVDVNEDAYRINLMVLHNARVVWTESIYVPANGEGLPQVANLQTTACDGNIMVSWEAPVRTASGYMIHWTHDGSTYFWVESKDTNITLYDLENFIPYNITVTPLFDNKTGLGRQVQDCSRRGAPGAVSIDVDTKDTSAHVKWRIDSQKQCSGVVVNYKVFYRAKDSDQLNHITVNPSDREVSLGELEPGTTYSIHVEAVSLTGNTTSNHQQFKTHWVDPSFIKFMIVSIISLVVIIVFLAVCCVVQWKKYKQKMVPDPHLSSIALWASQYHQKIVLVLSNPSESLSTCDSIYPCEQEEQDNATVYSTLLPTGNWGVTSSESANGQTEESTTYFIASEAGERDDSLPVEKTNLQLCPAKLPAAVSQMEETNNPLLVPTTVPSEISLPNPYQSQSVEEGPPVWSATDADQVLQTVQQQGEMAQLSVYVTMNMFEAVSLGKNRNGDYVS